MVRILVKVCFLVAAVILVSCENNRFEANIAEQKYELDLLRLDQELFKAPSEPKKFYAWLDSLNQKNPDFIKIYLGDIMRVGILPDSAVALRLLQFKNDTLWQGLQKEVDGHHADFSKNKEEISNAVKRIRYFFEDMDVPKLTTFNSGFNVAVYPTTQHVGIGLEWFLDTGSVYLKMLPPENFPQWKKAGMVQENLVPEAIKGWLLHNFYEDYWFEQDLLRQMVFYGKIMLLTEVAIPESDLTEVFKYTEEQMDWAFDNQEGVWAELVKKEMLFSTNFKEINRLTIDGPFTNTFGNSSPPRIAWYLGWQMVKQYADKKDLPLKDIIKDHNEREILKTFRPGKTLK